MGWLDGVVDDVNKFVKNSTEEAIGTVNTVIDGTVEGIGIASTTVIGGMVEGGQSIAIGSTEVGGNILGTLGEGMGGGLQGIFDALGIPTPNQMAGDFSTMLLLGGAALIAIIWFSRNKGPASPPPSYMMGPGGQVMAM
jgi:hypothetical protein